MERIFLGSALFQIERLWYSRSDAGSGKHTTITPAVVSAVFNGADHDRADRWRRDRLAAA